MSVSASFGNKLAQGEKYFEKHSICRKSLLSVLMCLVEAIPIKVKAPTTFWPLSGQNRDTSNVLITICPVIWSVTRQHDQHEQHLWLELPLASWAAPVNGSAHTQWCWSSTEKVKQKRKKKEASGILTQGARTRCPRKSQNVVHTYNKNAKSVIPLPQICPGTPCLYPQDLPESRWDLILRVWKPCIHHS